MFLVTIPPMDAEEITTYGAQLTKPQQHGERYAQAMATYLQWIAQEWLRLATHLPARYATLRQEAAAAGCHAREPGQVAYLQLAWETFTQCALDHGAISAAERSIILATTNSMFLDALAEHAAVLHEEKTVVRFLTYLRAGLASKQIYVGDLEDVQPPHAGDWGWTEFTEWDHNAKEYRPVYKPAQALLVGYVDQEYIYLIPKTLQQYLHQAAKAEDKPWPVDPSTLLRELQGAGVIHTKQESDGRWRRQLGKKIQGTTFRCIWVHRATVVQEEDAHDEEEDRIPF